MAPTYFTVAGLHPVEGAVITRERGYTEGNIQCKSDNEPLVQTNMDASNVGEKSAEHDWQDICESRFRFAVAESAIASVDNRPSVADLWSICSTRPCLAHDTIYTVLMIPRTGEYVTRVQVTRGAASAARRRWSDIVRGVAAGASDANGSATGARRQ